MIDNPDRAVVIGVAAATARARATAFAAGAAAIREGQATGGVGGAIHDQARAIADRMSLLPTLIPTTVSGAPASGFDLSSNLVAEEVEEAGVDEVEAAEGAFDISAEAVDAAEFVEIDLIEIII